MCQDSRVHIDAIAVGDELVELVLVRLPHRRPNEYLRENVCQVCRLLLPCRQHVVEDMLSIAHRDASVRRDDLVDARFALLDDVHQAARAERALELPQVCVD